MKAVLAVKTFYLEGDFGENNYQYGKQPSIFLEVITPCSLRFLIGLKGRQNELFPLGIEKNVRIEKMIQKYN